MLCPFEVQQLQQFGGKYVHCYSLKLVLHGAIFLEICLATLENETNCKLKKTCYTLLQHAMVLKRSMKLSQKVEPSSTFAPGGALPYKPIRNGLFPKRVLTIFQEQKAIVLKNNRLLFSLLFCNLKIPKQGIKMQIFFLNGLWRLLKNGHLPRQVTFKCPPRLLQF